MTQQIAAKSIELAVQAEVTYALDPGVASGTTDFFAHQAEPGWLTAVASREDVTDENSVEPSVLRTVKGRSTSSWTIPCKVIPSGNATTPTAPDTDLLWKAVMGTQHANLAHSTTTTGSTTTVVNLTAGGVAAMNLIVGDIIIVDVSVAVGFEPRQVVSIATDNVTVDRALTAAPLSGRQVLGGVTFKLLKNGGPTLHIKQFSPATGAFVWKKKIAGALARSLEIAYDASASVPSPTVTFQGTAKLPVTHTDALPGVITKLGIPIPVAITKLWIGTKTLCILDMTLTIDNSRTLRDNTSCSLEPTGPLGMTDNDGKYLVSLQGSAYWMHPDVGTDEDTEILHDEAPNLTPRDLVGMIGTTAGNIIAFRIPKWIPDSEIGEVNTMFSVNLSGRCYAVVGSDEATIAFL